MNLKVNEFLPNEFFEIYNVFYDILSGIREFVR